MGLTAKLPSVALGALVVTLLSISYFALLNLCLLGILTGSWTAVWHYSASSREFVPYGSGALLGATAALVGSIVAFVVEMPLSALGIGAADAIIGFFDAFFRQAFTTDQWNDFVASARGESADASDVLVSLITPTVVGGIGGLLGSRYSARHR